MQIAPILSLFGNMEPFDLVQLNFNQESVDLMNTPSPLSCLVSRLASNLNISESRDASLNRSVGSRFSISFVAGTHLPLVGGASQQFGSLGMILVAACPGGNVSNLISAISKSNITLSVSLTASPPYLALL